MRATLYEAEHAKQHAAADRTPAKPMMGSGDRSQRIRTYNFPQNRCTDHASAAKAAGKISISEQIVQETWTRLSMHSWNWTRS